MTVKARFFATFRDLFGGREREVDSGGRRTVREVLEFLCETPVQRAEVFEGAGLKPQVVVMVNGVHIRSLQGLDTPLSDGDTLAIFPFLGGG